MDYPKYAADIINRLEEHGYEAYIVGGSVRDLLLGKEPNDYDVTTSALPDTVLNIFSDLRCVPTGIIHGTVTVISQGQPIEVTTFRIDGDYLDQRHPEEVCFTEDIAKDLSRRDFTVNAMAYNTSHGVIDLFGGRNDLESKIIRAVGDPERRFSEDALRILRAFRFSAQLGFDIDGDTLRAAAAKKDGLSRIARERIASEFTRTICFNTPSTSLFLMIENGIFDFIMGGYIPSVSAVNALGKAPSAEHVRLGILLCELEKEKARDILLGLRLSNKLISLSLRIADGIRTPCGQSDAEARRFIGRTQELALDVLEAKRALSCLDADFDKKVRAELAAKHCTNGSELAVNGADLVKLGIRGREVGRTLEYLLSRVLEEPSLNERDTLLTLAKNRMENITEID